MITPVQIENVLEEGYRSGAATLATPVTDTIKIVDENGLIVSTPDRSTMWAVQTPQVFEKELYKRALKNAMENNISVTDDCSMVEALGETVHTVLGNYSNIKLTTPVDITIAEALLSKRK